MAGKIFNPAISVKIPHILNSVYKNCCPVSVGGVGSTRKASSSVPYVVYSDISVKVAVIEHVTSSCTFENKAFVDVYNSLH